VRGKAGKPLAGICVMASAKVRLGKPAKTLPFRLFYVSRTAKNGTYAVYNFPPGFNLIPVSWHILFEVGCGNTGNYAPQWWRARAFETQATTLLAKPHGGTLTNINATLTEGATMAGVIRAGSGTGAGLPGVCVAADGRGRQAGVSISTRTGTAGRYALRGLGTGTYRDLPGPARYLQLRQLSRQDLRTGVDARPQDHDREQFPAAGRHGRRHGHQHGGRRARCGRHLHDAEQLARLLR
jgi:hypothetical protein